jgi:hypothetical protein
VRIADAISELQIVEHRLHQLKIIDRDSAAILAAVRERLDARRREGAGGVWHYEISRDQPLTFTPVRINYDLRVDLFGQFSEPDRGVPQANHSITVRVWGLKKTCWFDPALDAPRLETLIDNGLGRRVMLRFRLDCAQANLDEPWFHMQFGGQQFGEEYFRLPQNFGVPRFTYYPMNLLLVCEFIVRHFFPAEFVELSEEPSWKRALRIAQQAYLRHYLAKIDDFDRNCETSFLAHCWTR